ncbi:hypothetical protein [Haliscomenobacter sp.]|uniref:hypothetical protein n=1 Tax=Haliscomenobacter sp. TaxID=2717303 RepID=UPI0033650047
MATAIPRIISATDKVPQTKPGESAVGGVGAPPKADAAPKPGATTLGSGLCAALNTFYAEQAKSSGFIPDVYEIKFADPILENASIVPPGPLDKSMAGGSVTATAADQLLSEKQSMSPTVRQKSATAGQQIVQFIDTVIRSSSYITAQQKVIWNSETNTWDPNGPSPQRFAWFSVSCDAQPLKYDPKQNDFAYKMIYTVAPYQTPVASEYFDSGASRGVHKVFNYWFTGQNTQILQYEQEFNKLWSQAITSYSTAEDLKQSVNSRELWKKRTMPASGQARQGGDGKTFEPGANAADYLYSVDQANIRLVIMGDPAWIPSPKAMQPGKFVSAPFEADGTINAKASGAYFEFAWNQPRDYDLNTGLMDPGKNNYFADRSQGKAGLAQEAVTYQATHCKSTFRGGKFTQELKGIWVTDTAPTKTTDTGRNTTPPTVPAKTSGVGDRIIAATGGALPTNQIIQSTSKVLQAGAASVVPANAEYTAPAPTTNVITSISGAQPLPAKPASVEGVDIPTTQFQPPPVLSGKPGENRLGGFDLSPDPSQGVVNDDQGT